MASARTGLLLITQMRTVLTNCSEMLMKSVGSRVERKLYVALHLNVASKIGKEANGGAATFDFIADVYRAASIFCKPTLDVRILLGNLKDDFHSSESKPEQQKSNLLERIYRQVDCILVDNAETNREILDEIRNCGIDLKSKLIDLDILRETNNSTKPRICSTFANENDCRTDASICKYSGVVLGGTFDRIHNGHKILLSTAILLAKNQLTCGVTDGAMLENKVLCEFIEPIERRIEILSEFVDDVDGSVSKKIVPITDPYGPSIVDTDLQCIVASKETLRGVFRVNEERGKRGLDKLDVFICNLIDDEIADMCAADEKKVSSSKMRQMLLGELLSNPTPNPRIDQSPYVIGLTGGIATGKSHIAKYMQSLGAFLIDCDQLGHEAYLPGKPAYEKIVKTFGEDTVDKTNNGVINRQILGKKVFSDPAALRTLNEIVWPEIIRLAKERMRQAKNEGAKVIVLDAAVLFEAGWQDDVHETWLCVIPPSEAIKRIQDRNKLSEEEAKQRLQAQKMSNKERVARSNVVFCSLWDYPVTRAQVKKAWDNLMNRLSDKSSKM